MIGAFVQMNLDSMQSGHWPIGYVVQESGCWEWVGDVSNNGYPSWVRDGKRLSIHRVVATETYGPIPRGAVVRHLCNNRLCIRPEHLAVGTQKENIADMWAAGNQGSQYNRRPRCKRGHPLADPNVVYSRDRKERSCRACRTLWRRRVDASVAPRVDLGAILAEAEAHLA
jgi:hypothetical protein